MASIIAVAGKGGTGKTTFCGMLIDWMCRQKMGPVLAVDADANSNLNEVLGVEVETTLGDIRETVAQADIATDSPIPPGMTKQDYIDCMFRDAVVEEDDFDLLVFCRPSCRSWRAPTAGWWWTTKPAWSTSAGASCPRWTTSCW